MVGSNHLDRRQYIKNVGAALGLGASVSAASQSAGAAETDKPYQIEITPIEDKAIFNLEFADGVEPTIAQSPESGYAWTFGSQAYGRIDDSSETAIIGLNEYEPRKIAADLGSFVLGVEYIEENDPCSSGCFSVPYDPDRFCQFEVSGDGKYLVGVPYSPNAGGNGPTVDSQWNDKNIWGFTAEVNDSVEYEISISLSNFAGLNEEQADTFYFLPPVPSSGVSGFSGPIGISFTSQDQSHPMEYRGADEPLGARWAPYRPDHEFGARPLNVDGEAHFGFVKGGVDKYQTAMFKRDPPSWTDSADFYDPEATLPTWFRLEGGVEVDIFTTDTNRGDLGKFDWWEDNPLD